MCNLYITFQYTSFSNFSSIFSGSYESMHCFDMSLKPSKRSEHREKFLFRRGKSSLSSESCEVSSGGRSSLTAQYSAHAPRNVECPSPQHSPKKIILQFLQVSFSERYSSSSFFCWNALKIHPVFSSFRGAKCKIFFLRVRFRRIILLYKQIGLKKWLTAIEDPIKCLLSSEIFANTLGLKVFPLSSFVNQ